jgi:5-formyltetrahydrofolate cyclo-ligase
MEYRAWDRREPGLRDECGIPACDGPVVVPDVVLVPCVGFTASGHRLGYGGGYFDRWLAEHRHVTAVGVAWSVTELGEAELAPQPHDLALALVVTERGVVS